MRVVIVWRCLCLYTHIWIYICARVGIRTYARVGLELYVFLCISRSASLSLSLHSSFLVRFTLLFSCSSILLTVWSYIVRNIWHMTIAIGRVECGIVLNIYHFGSMSHSYSWFLSLYFPFGSAFIVASYLISYTIYSYTPLLFYYTLSFL